MSENCQLVVFSNKAYNAIIRESFDKNPVETGGILLGHILDNGVWIVMEVLPPGENSIFQYAYFEYDEAFVNYLAHTTANQYKYPLDLLGLWHRHPGSMDVFSSTDDSTNITFARQNPKGVISGLVNIDPRFRLTMYHLDNPDSHPTTIKGYDVVDMEVGDDIIPEEFFELRYYQGENADLHPLPNTNSKERNLPHTINSRSDYGESDYLKDEDVVRLYSLRELTELFFLWGFKGKRGKIILPILVLLLVVGACSTVQFCKESVTNASTWVDQRTKNVVTSSNSKFTTDSIDILVGSQLNLDSLVNCKNYGYKTEDTTTIKVQQKIIKAVAVGKTQLEIYSNGELKKIIVVSVNPSIDENPQSNK